MISIRNLIRRIQLHPDRMIVTYSDIKEFIKTKDSSFLVGCMEDVHKWGWELAVGSSHFGAIMEEIKAYFSVITIQPDEVTHCISMELERRYHNAHKKFKHAEMKPISDPVPTKTRRKARASKRQTTKKKTKSRKSGK